MNITDLLKTSNQVQLLINAIDLKEAFLQWSEESNQLQVKNQEEETYLTAREAAENIGVTLSTLWRWDKAGYLKKTKVGRKNLYRLSDIEDLKGGADHE